MIIKFIGMEAQNAYYRIGVMQNNVTDSIVFELSAMQGDVDLSAYRPFLKITTPDMRYADKDGNLEVTPTDDGSLRLRYQLTRTVTQYHSVDMQLQFENYSIANIAVIQSTIFNIAFNATLPADEIVARKEPTVIQDHERRLQAVEATPSTVGVKSYTSKSDFPAIGASGVVYIDETQCNSYCFDAVAKIYYVVGSDYKKIKIINCIGGN